MAKSVPATMRKFCTNCPLALSLARMRSVSLSSRKPSRAAATDGTPMRTRVEMTCRVRVSRPRRLRDERRASVPIESRGSSAATTKMSVGTASTGSVSVIRPSSSSGATTAIAHDVQRVSGTNGYRCLCDCRNDAAAMDHGRLPPPRIPSRGTGELKRLSDHNIGFKFYTAPFPPPTRGRSSSCRVSLVTAAYNRSHRSSQVSGCMAATALTRAAAAAATTRARTPPPPPQAPKSRTVSSGVAWRVAPAWRGGAVEQHEAEHVEQQCRG
eukprot:scaffold96868_cov79-Phaeocystis_antarctica.AAC.3